MIIFSVLFTFYLRARRYRYKYVLFMYICSVGVLSKFEFFVVVVFSFFLNFCNDLRFFGVIVIFRSFCVRSICVGV